MSPLSPMVLGAAALVTSPAIYDTVVEQSLPLDQALIRYLVAVAICWALLSVLTEFALKPPPAARAAGADDAETAVLDIAAPAEKPAS
ncbi:hypothetical protein [Nocardioides sp. LHG3406-4]|uniref:hypothetical protein n=1 Tax=Nocardioides sp. LHG3406-4 TaxID=2804575 RepID=UPI003CEA58A1